MTRALHTPPTDLAGTPAGGRLWRKQILRKGTINYEGRPITFDDAYLAELTRAFDERALDQVPLQFADGRNAHTEDPERTRGHIVALERTPDGLDALVALSEQGEQTVRENPGLAVSARILEDHRRVDGKSWPRALAHVLATINPRITGMRPWAQVALANPDIPVVDLTSATFTERGQSMAELTDEQVAGLLALLDKPAGDPPTGVPAATPDDDLSDAEWQALLADANDDPTDASEPQLAGASLSAEAQAAINLANANAEQAAQTAAGLQADLTRSNWQVEAQGYVEAGCMPALVELAGQIIAPPLDLANGTPDPAAVVRQMVEATRGYIDFAVLGTAETDPDAETKALVAAWNANFGGN